MTLAEMDSRSEDTPAANPFFEGAAYVDGRYFPVKEAKIPLLDWGFLRSDACQETVSVWDGLFFRLEDHLDRFERSLGKLRMQAPIARGQIRGIMAELVRRTGYQRAYVQIIMTRGFPPVGSRDPRLCVNRFQAFCIPYVWIATPERQKDGLSLHFSAIRRVPPESVSPLVKHYHWLDFEMGLFEAFDAGAETVVLSDGDGNATEGPGFNLFLVKDDMLHTPEVGVLDGMTRRCVLEMGQDLGIPLRLVPLSPEMLRTAVELFITTTAGGIIPITRLDGVEVGTGLPGSMTMSLRKEYWERRNRGWHGTRVEEIGVLGQEHAQ